MISAEIQPQDRRDIRGKPRRSFFVGAGLEAGAISHFGLLRADASFLATRAFFTAMLC
jgi:hypothetical protein